MSLGWRLRSRAPAVPRCGHSYTPLEPTHRTSVPWRTTVALGVTVCAVMAWVAPNVMPRPGRQTTALDLNARDSSVKGIDADDDGTGMRVRLWNDYMTVGRAVELYPWAHVAEPYRKTVMEISSWPNETLKDDVGFRWTVGGTVQGTGVKLETAFGAPGQYKCKVTAFYPNVQESNLGRNAKTNSDTLDVEDVAAEHSFIVTVKYVRREIRSLTDRDREIFFNAVSVLQRVPSAVGQQVYGPKYYSKDFFNRVHLYYGGREDCDHWHDGAGFVTSHIAVSLMFEQALQAVNPSIALPYWDFTVEGTEYDWTDFRGSSVFSDDWFGEAAPRNEWMTPERGRFAFVPAMASAREYSDLTNAFGLLRSPWNTDPNPFLTRHDHVFQYSNNRKPAGCKQYRDAVRENSWMALTQALNAGAHGHIHELLGGTWSAQWSEFKDRTEEIVFPFIHAIVPLMKYLWREGYLECPDSCETDQSWQECQCLCQDNDKRASEVLEESGLLAKAVGAFFYDRDWNLIESLGDQEGHAQLQIPGYTEEETEDIYRELLRVLCTPMKIGTHYEGTSTNDITFWVLHPTFDRLWHLSRLDSVSDFSETWPDDHSCYGHNPKDVQPFHNLFVGDDVRVSEDDVQVPKVYYTNEELYELLRPDGLASPYVYDHFKWAHCDAMGIFMRKESHAGS